MQQPVRFASEEVNQLREIDTGKEHEDRCGPLDRRVVANHAVVPGREAPGGNRTEGMADGIEKPHSLQIHQCCLGDGQSNVGNPHMFRRVGYTRAEFLITDPCHLGAIELHSSESEHRQNGD